MKTKPKIHLTEATTLIRHEFTTAERLEMSKRQNTSLARIGELEAQASSVAKDFKAKVQAEDVVVQQIRNQLSDGYEMRPTRVVVEMFPKEGVKRFYALTDRKRKHPLGEDKMSPADYEMPLPFDQPNAPKPQPTAPDISKPPQDTEALAIAVIRSEGKASAALVMRRLKLTIGEAETIVESLEQRGILGPAAANGSREIINLPK